MNITPIIEAAFALIAAIITAVVVPYIRSKTTDTQQAELMALVRIAVTAAEQLYIGTGKGAEKKPMSWRGWQNGESRWTQKNWMP